MESNPPKNLLGNDGDGSFLYEKEPTAIFLLFHGRVGDFHPLHRMGASGFVVMVQLVEVGVKWQIIEEDG